MGNSGFPVSIEAAKAALAMIPSSDRDVWCRMGMALKSEFGEVGEELFLSWSETSSNFEIRSAKSVWKSFKSGGPITIGTLIAEAKRHGFNPKKYAQAVPLSEDAKEKIRRERAERDAAAAASIMKLQEAAAVDAEKIWDAAAINGAAEYLQRKKVKGEGVRFLPMGTLAIPMRDSEGKLWNVQRIYANGDKRFLTDAKVSGCFHQIGDFASSPWILIAEGYATAASLYEATGFAVVVAFNESNIKHVGAAIRRIFPDAKLLFCADDDAETEKRTGKNPGVNAAMAAAKANSGYWCKPEGLNSDATDFNDLANLAGLDSVRDQINSALAACNGDAAAMKKTAANSAPVSKENSASEKKVEQRKSSDKKASTEGSAVNSRGIDRSTSGAARPFFHVDERGVWYHGFSQQGDPLPAQWICSELHITAKSRDSSNGDWGYLLEFKDGDNNPKRWAMPASMLAGDGTQYRANLLSMGLQIAAGTAAKNHLTVYIQTQQTEVRVRCTDRIGWHDHAYVLPDTTIGGGDEKVMFQASGGVISQFKQRGSLDDWKQEIASYCRGNSRLTFCVSAAFAAPLLYLAHVPSGGFHIWGDSSSGKSTAFKVAGSVFGGKDYPRNWRMTDNALETVAAQHSDALLLLDEIAQVDAKVVGDTVYMLANETGKGRATQTATARKVATWRILFLSDGEVSLANHMEQAGKGTKAGHDVRMAHIAADAGKGFGLYETLNGFSNGAELSDHLVSKAHQHYGTAGMAFIEYAVRHAVDLRGALQTNVSELAREFCPLDAHGQVARVATRFALVGIAGELATTAGITGWSTGDAISAARVCFTAWLDGRGGAGNTEHTAILSQVSGFFQIHGDSRFVWWHRAMDDRKPNTINRAGFKRLLTKDGKAVNSNSDHYAEFGDVIHPDQADDTELEYFVLPEVFRTEICKGFSVKAVTHLLLERKLLIPSGSGDKLRADRSERLPGMGNTRCYRFSPRIVSADF